MQTKQLQITLCNRTFNISLNNLNKKAYSEICELLSSNNLDLLDLIRAYIANTQEKCELESKLEAMIDKIQDVG